VIRQCYIKDSPHIGLTFGFGNARVFIRGQTKSQICCIYLPYRVSKIIFRLEMNKSLKLRLVELLEKSDRL